MDTEIERDIRVEGVRTTRAEINCSGCDSAWGGGTRERESWREAHESRHTLGLRNACWQRKRVRESHMKGWSHLSVWIRYADTPSNPPTEVTADCRRTEQRAACMDVALCACVCKKKLQASFCPVTFHLTTNPLFHILKWLYSTSHFLVENINSPRVCVVTVQMVEH